MLEDYAAQHGFTNCIHYTDDGYSGGTFDRPSWKRLLADIEAGKVGTVLAKHGRGTHQKNLDAARPYNDHRKAKTKVFAAKRLVWRQMI